MGKRIHHCKECGRSVGPRCWKQGHIAACDAPGCTGFYQTLTGCSFHSYSEGHNAKYVKFRHQRLEKKPLDGSEEADPEGTPDAIAAEEQEAEKEEKEEDAPATSVGELAEKPAEKLSRRQSKRQNEPPAGGWNRKGLQRRASKKPSRKSDVHEVALGLKRRL